MLMFSSAFVMVDVGENGVVEGKVVVRDGVMYTAHTPILITSNVDFTPANGVTDGNGTEVNPWIIEGWDIDGFGSNYCIYIGDTTNYFIIKDCYLAFSDNYGIYFNNVINGEINSNIIRLNWDGIYLYSSDSNTIDNNTITKGVGGSHGIFLYDSSDDNIIINNNVSSNQGTGIFLSVSCDGNTIAYNDASNNNRGIGLYSSNSNTIFNNNVYSNGYCGIEIIYSDGNTIYHNNLENDDPLINLGRALSSDSTWDNGYPSGGNYWSDYSGADLFSGPNQDQPGADSIGDTPYTFTGGQDNYPLMYPYVWWEERPPNIELSSPPDNSVIQAGEIIYFNIWDENYNLNNTNYSVNGGTNQSFTVSYRIYTTGWADGDYGIVVHVNDTANNNAIGFYNFTVDSTKPDITLNSPANNSITPVGPVVDFDVTDPHLDTVLYAVNDGGDQTFNPPYDIDMTGWSDGVYNIKIDASDIVGNINIEIYTFTIDSIAPEIILNLPTNNSIIPPSTILDFDVIDLSLNIVNYSLNAGGNVSLFTPFDVDTTSWSEGLNVIEIHANDALNHNVSRSYNFIIDSTDPIITLNSPLNNTVIVSGLTIDLNVFDEHLDCVNFSINGGANQSLNPPFNINTTGWNDGLKMVEVHAIDEAGNTAIKIYNFTIDSTIPIITLNSPANNSVILSGTTFDFNVTDPHLNIVNYSINGGLNIAFGVPYDIDTTDWIDGEYIIEIHANDSVGNQAVKSFLFTIDSTDPVIVLNLPANQSVISAGTVIDFYVIDENIDVVNYSVNGGADQTLNFPYDINTVAWAEGLKFVKVQTMDKAGNTAVEIYEFTIDTTIPTVTLNSPANNSIILSGTILDFGITDPHLNEVNYSTNGGANTSFPSPYNINTTGWSDGIYTIEVHAVDGAGNTAIGSYTFTIDGTAPIIISTIPLNNSVELPINLTIVIEFNESMNISSVENAISINPSVSISNYDWNADATILTITLSSNLTQNTMYTITIGTGAQDDVGNTLTSTYYFLFSTWIDTDDDGIPDSQDPDDDNDGIPDEDDPDPLDPTITGEPETPGTGNYWWVLILLMAGILAALLFMRRKPGAEPPEPAIETEECPNCGFEIEPGTTCPFCVEEPKPPEPKKPSLGKEELLERVEKAYNEGKLSEEQYLKNLERFK